VLETPRIKVAKPRRAHPDKALTAVHVRNIKAPGRYCDGNGLYLVVDPSGAKRWMVRTVILGKRCDIGLGSVRLVSLAEAREEALRIAFVATTTLSAVDGRKAAYMGATHAAYSAAKDSIEGTLNTGLEEALVLTPEKKEYAGQELRIPYNRVIDLEYGQKAGRRVGLATGLAIVSLVGLVALFSKKRRHYLTIGYYDDAGKEQVAILELGKDIVRTGLSIIETRSGKKIEYQDEEAKKASRGN
jgi:hypothetical protein